MRVSDLAFVSALDAAAAIQQGRITSIELTKHLFKRIDQFNPALNAIITFMRDEALDRAQAADAALANGEEWGPFHGVPCTVKDCFETAHVRTTAGVLSLTDHVPENDAIAVGRLRAAGFVLIGHTNVPEMAGDWQSYNKIFGTTNNPWNLEKTPGGSTGGGAAALAAGLSYLSLGSDIGGSIRVPAHFCGVYGHKPSLNVVPNHGHIPQSAYFPPLLNVSGPLARSAKDLKRTLECLGGPAPEEAKAYRWALPPARKTSLAGYRLGYVVDDPLCPVSPDVKEIMLSVMNRLQGTGLDLEEGWPSNMQPNEQFTTYRFLLACHFAHFLKDEEYDAFRKRALNQDGGHEVISAKAWTVPHKHFHAALSAQQVAREAWQSYFATHDAFLLPTAFIPAFPHDHSLPYWSRRLSTPHGPRSYEDLMFWISFATLAGLPATTAPIGHTKTGLPVGIQIIGPYLEDATPIDVADKLTTVLGGFTPPDRYCSID